MEPSLRANVTPKILPHDPRMPISTDDRLLRAAQISAPRPSPTTITAPFKSKLARGTLPIIELFHF